MFHLAICVFRRSDEAGNAARLHARTPPTFLLVETRRRQPGFDDLTRFVKRRAIRQTIA
jgi:hypothetical protein